ncbi:alpha/beta hydrolase [Microbacterium sp. BK668]|uniref:alpha/beta fold hydrolase n=1 Tax=Microbacterium sp. BK668 TaxID=2512118 RepID=UPI00105E9E32|nr:alpha/beta hydrolase [Microbacterium sp. BK668]TDN92593.1 pimeloyl-ACP methyl ester carboxylesterase [Microbacterium sp. BK668]
MTGHDYRAIDVPVSGGSLRVGVWEPEEDAGASVLVVHGVTASHLAWPFVVERLPGVRVIAPDLRGRGRSNELEGPAGMAAHAADLAAVLDRLGIERIVVVGHSMGAFVSVVFAHLHPGHVARLVLIDGGLPLDVPAGLPPDELVSRILGPTAARLSMRFADAGEYRGFWREHPAFHTDWTPELERYIEYDLVPEGDAFRPATSYRTTVEDTIDMNTGTALPDALARLRHPALLITAPRGLLNEPPGLYPPAYLARLLPAHPGVDHVRVHDRNHYTIVMSERGADAVAPLIRRELAAAETVPIE